MSDWLNDKNANWNQVFDSAPTFSTEKSLQQVKLVYEKVTSAIKLVCSLYVGCKAQHRLYFFIPRKIKKNLQKEWNCILKFVSLNNTWDLSVCNHINQSKRQGSWNHWFHTKHGNHSWFSWLQSSHLVSSFCFNNFFKKKYVCGIYIYMRYLFSKNCIFDTISNLLPWVLLL